MRNGTKTIFDGMNRLVDDYVAHVEWLVLVVVATAAATRFRSSVHGDHVIATTIGQCIRIRIAVHEHFEIILFLQQVRLDDQHPGNAHQCTQQQNGLEKLLSTVPVLEVTWIGRVVGRILVQEHVDQVDENGWCTSCTAEIVHKPFDKDQQVHVAKNAEEKDDLRYELAQNVQCFVEVATNSLKLITWKKGN